MPIPQLVEIGSKEVSDVFDIKVSIRRNASASDNGAPPGPARSAAIRLTRHSHNTPTTRFFRYAASKAIPISDDEKKKSRHDKAAAFPGKIVFQDSRDKETYRIEWKLGSVVDYEFVQSEADADLQETITIRVEDLAISAAGGKAEVEWTRQNVPK